MCIRDSDRVADRAPRGVDGHGEHVDLLDRRVIGVSRMEQPTLPRRRDEDTHVVDGRHAVVVERVLLPARADRHLANAQVITLAQDTCRQPVGSEDRRGLRIGIQGDT